MADDWDRILETFKPPWKIVHRKNGALWIEDANKRKICYVYPKNNQTNNFEMPSEEEALTIVKAIAKMSKRRK